MEILSVSASHTVWFSAADSCPRGIVPFQRGRQINLRRGHELINGRGKKKKKLILLHRLFFFCLVFFPLGFLILGEFTSHTLLYIKKKKFFGGTETTCRGGTLGVCGVTQGNDTCYIVKS